MNKFFINLVFNNHSIMKSSIFFLIILSFALFVTSCSKEDDKHDDINTNTNINTETNNNGPTPNASTYVQESDLYGVWSVPGNKDLYFIYFTETGHYSLCFNNHIMGSGKYKIENNSLSLSNGYLFTKDVLVVKKEGEKLNLTGEMTLFKSSNKENIDITINKTNKNIPVSPVGEKVKIFGLHVTKGSVVTQIQYQSENLIHYLYYTNNSLQQILGESMWYYVYNDGLTYTQDCSRYGEVVIYDLRNPNSGSLTTHIVKQ